MRRESEWTKVFVWVRKSLFFAFTIGSEGGEGGTSDTELGRREAADGEWWKGGGSVVVGDRRRRRKLIGAGAAAGHAQGLLGHWTEWTKIDQCEIDRKVESDQGD